MGTFTAPEEDLSFDQGDSETFVLTRQNSDGTAKDITNYIFWLTIKESTSDSDADAAVQKEVTTHTDPVNGTTEIDLTAADTDGLDGNYVYDLQEKTDAGIVNTLMWGTLYVRVDVTNTTT